MEVGIDLNWERKEDMYQEAREDEYYEQKAREDYDWFLDNYTEIDEIVDMIKELEKQHFNYGWDSSGHAIFEQISGRL